jgi:hypothetical protein
MKSKIDDKPSVIKEILRLKKLPQSPKILLKIQKLQQRL